MYAREGYRRDGHLINGSVGGNVIKMFFVPSFRMALVGFIG
jgi:hypothetical protein